MATDGSRPVRFGTIYNIFRLKIHQGGEAMKKLFIVLILILLFALPSAACSGNKQIPKTDAVLAGKIVQIYDHSFLLAGKNAADLYMIQSSLKIYDANNNAADASALKAGQEAEIGYSGGIMESYPMQLGKPAYIKITGQGEDLVGFYQTILNDLWNVDQGLNPDSGVLAFDLTQVENLSNAEKSALVYIVSGSYGLTGLAGTFDELGEQGYINRENLYFENGMLFEFELTNVTQNSFTFDVKKWRSGTGAYIFHDCKAVKSGDDWNYTVGAEMISAAQTIRRAG
jgi:hypothetical protein